MLIIKIVTEDGSREIPVKDDNSWAVEADAGYLIINRVDNLRIFYPLDTIIYWEIGSNGS